MDAGNHQLLVWQTPQHIRLFYIWPSKKSILPIQRKSQVLFVYHVLESPRVSEFRSPRFPTSPRPHVPATPRPRVPESPRPRVSASPRPRVPASPRPHVPASIRREGNVDGVVHKNPVTKEQMEMLFERQQLGPADAKCPSQLLRTSWFYITLYFEQRGRENQRRMTKTMLALRRAPLGKRYYELERQIPGAVLATKNHQGGLNDEEDESDGKMFEVPGSPRCPVQTVENYISHLNPKMDFLFQRRRVVSNKFNPEAHGLVL